MRVAVSEHCRRGAILLALVGLVLGAGLAAAGAARATARFDPRNPVFGRPHRVSWDKYSLLIDGHRLAVWAGEFHMFRLPSPQLWRDVLEKLKAGGYNTVSLYISWAYQSPRPGVYDFSGVRNVDLLLRMAERAGLYVIIRPGPYINAELDSGGFPGWLTEQAGVARTVAPDYTQAWTDYLSALDPIIARHQITRGGSVIAYQIENELLRTENETPYMSALVAKVHADGIDVPTTANIVVAPGWTGIVDMSGPDDYPQGFDCSKPQQWSSQIALELDNLETNTRVDSPTTPGFTPEFQGGSFDPWGGTGYANCYQLTDGSFEKVINETASAQGATMRNLYMAYGGTSWGWQAVPSDYTSYDYGAAIDEARQLTPKYYELKRLAYASQALGPLTQTTRMGTPSGSNSDLLYALRENPSTHTQFIFLRHHDPTSTASASTRLSLQTPDGSYPTVPQQRGSAIWIHGRDMKLLVADLAIGREHLVYSTSEPMSYTRIGGRDVAVFYGTRGDPGETVLRYASRPSVSVLQGHVSRSWNRARGDLRLDYRHRGLSRVLIVDRHRTLLLIFDDEQDAGRIWLTPTRGSGPVLSYGPYLVRAASIRGGVLALRGETSNSFPRAGQRGGATGTSPWTGSLRRHGRPSALTILAAPRLKGVTWNGRRLRTRRTRGTVAATLPGPPRVALPRLRGWRFEAEAPEAQPGFSDSTWTAANKLVPGSPVRLNGQVPVLDMDDYGFHYGNVWYRGHFTATGSESGVKLDCETGGGPSTCSVWLNGRFLLTTSASGTQTVAFPSHLLRKGRSNVLSVLAEDDGHPEDFLIPTDMQKAGRGLTLASLQGSPAPMTWRIQGTRGGDNPVDRLHGPLNNGGLYGERNGWYAPSFDDSHWRRVALPDRWSTRHVPPGVGWYRTAFRLRLPRNADIPVGLRINDNRRYRYEALIFLNGWMMGRYANDVGPQHLFYLPQGVLDPRGRNVLAIAVLSHGQDGSGGGIGTVSLQAYGRYGR